MLWNRLKKPEDLEIIFVYKIAVGQDKMAAEEVEASSTCSSPQTRFIAKLRSDQSEQPTEV